MKLRHLALLLCIPLAAQTVQPNTTVGMLESPSGTGTDWTPYIGTSSGATTMSPNVLGGLLQCVANCSSISPQWQPWPGTSGSGSGTVNSGTAFSPAFYPATGAAVSGVTPFTGLQYDSATAAPAAATSAQIQSVVGFQVVNALQYGVNGNGTFDNSTAITNAINGAAATGLAANTGAILEFPAGTFSYSLTQPCPRNILFHGQGPSSTYLKYTGTVAGWACGDLNTTGNLSTIHGGGFRDLTLYGPGNTGSVIGVLLGGDPAGTINSSATIDDNFVWDNVYVTQYGIGAKLGANAYLGTFTNVRWLNNQITWLDDGSCATIGNNCGERMVFDKNQFVQCTSTTSPCFVADTNNADYYISNSSSDYNNASTYDFGNTTACGGGSTCGTKLTFVNDHFEKLHGGFLHPSTTFNPYMVSVFGGKMTITGAGTTDPQMVWLDGAFSTSARFTMVGTEMTTTEPLTCGINAVANTGRKVWVENVWWEDYTPAYMPTVVCNNGQTNDIYVDVKSTTPQNADGTTKTIYGAETVGSGGSLAATGTGTIVATSSKDSGALSPLNYGVVCDAVEAYTYGSSGQYLYSTVTGTDNTTAMANFYAALANATQPTGASVEQTANTTTQKVARFPPGCGIKVTTLPTRAPDGVDFELNNSSIYVTGTSGNGIIFQNTNAGSTPGTANDTIRNGRIINATGSQYTNTGVGVAILYGVSNTIENVTVSGFGIGIECAGGEYSNFHNNKIAYNQVGIALLAASPTSPSVPSSSGQPCIDNTWSVGNTVRSNLVGVVSNGGQKNYFGPGTVSFNTYADYIFGATNWGFIDSLTVTNGATAVCTVSSVIPVTPSDTPTLPGEFYLQTDANGHVTGGYSINGGKGLTTQNQTMTVPTGALGCSTAPTVTGHVTSLASLPLPYSAATTAPNTQSKIDFQDMEGEGTNAAGTLARPTTGFQILMDSTATDEFVSRAVPGIGTGTSQGFARLLRTEGGGVIVEDSLLAPGNIDPITQSICPYMETQGLELHSPRENGVPDGLICGSNALPDYSVNNAMVGWKNNTLRAHGYSSLGSAGSSATTETAFEADEPGDTAERVQITPSGDVYFGSGAAASDVQTGRISAGIWGLKVGSFQAPQVALQGSYNSKPGFYFTSAGTANYYGGNIGLALDPSFNVLVNLFGTAGFRVGNASTSTDVFSVTSAGVGQFSGALSSASISTGALTTTGVTTKSNPTVATSGTPVQAPPATISTGSFYYTPTTTAYTQYVTEQFTPGFNPVTSFITPSNAITSYSGQSHFRFGGVNGVVEAYNSNDNSSASISETYSNMFLGITNTSTNVFTFLMALNMSGQICSIVPTATAGTPACRNTLDDGSGNAKFGSTTAPQFKTTPVIVTSSATPALVATNGLQTITLSANSTPTITGIASGQRISFQICQPATGGPYTWTWPASIHGGITIGTTASTCSMQSFNSFNGTTLVPESTGVINIAP